MPRRKNSNRGQVQAIKWSYHNRNNIQKNGYTGQDRYADRPSYWQTSNTKDGGDQISMRISIFLFMFVASFMLGSILTSSPYSIFSYTYKENLSEAIFLIGLEIWIFYALFKTYFIKRLIYFYKITKSELNNLDQININLVGSKKNFNHTLLGKCITF